MIRHTLREGFVWSHEAISSRNVCRRSGTKKTRVGWRGYGTLHDDYSDFYRATDAAVQVPTLPVWHNTRRGAERSGLVAAVVFCLAVLAFNFRVERRNYWCAPWKAKRTSNSQIPPPFLASGEMRWRVIYDRVESVATDLLPKPSGPVSESRRGKEKRRCIIEYVRNHPEEVRPFAVSQGRG